MGKKKLVKKAAGTTRKREASQDAYTKFVNAWNSASTREEALKNCGVSEKKAQTWCTKLRAKDITLKKFPRKSNIDFDAVKKAANKALKAA